MGEKRSQGEGTERKLQVELAHEQEEVDTPHIGEVSLEIIWVPTIRCKRISKVGEAGGTKE